LRPGLTLTAGFATGQEFAMLRFVGFFGPTNFQKIGLLIP